MRRPIKVQTKRLSIAQRTAEVYPRIKAYTALERIHDPLTDTTLLYGIRADGSRVGTTAAVWTLNELSLSREQQNPTA